MTMRDHGKAAKGLAKLPKFLPCVLPNLSRFFPSIFLSQGASCDGQSYTENYGSPCARSETNTLPLFQNQILVKYQYENTIVNRKNFVYFKSYSAFMILYTYKHLVIKFIHKKSYSQQKWCQHTETVQYDDHSALLKRSETIFYILLFSFPAQLSRVISNALKL